MKDKEHPNTYIVQDLRNGEELERLSLQDAMLTSSVGGVFAEQPEAFIVQLQHILDVGCGTGGWLREVAHLYPNIEKLVGVDISKQTIEYAKRQLEEQERANRVLFFVMDALQVLKFSENTFDLVNLRLGISFLRTWDWPQLLQEFRRVARPGGMIRLLDAEIGSQCSSSALTKLHTLLQQAFYRSGHFFSEGADGLTSHLPDLMTQHGYVNIKKHIFSLTYGGGTKEAEAYQKDIELTFRAIRPFLKKWGAMIPQYDDIYHQALEDMKQPNFRAVGNFVAVYGQKEGMFQPPLRKATMFHSTTTSHAPQKHALLTERETQVVLLVAQGLTNSQIANQLAISVKTVNTHLSSIYARMNFSGSGSARAQIIRYALENHLADTKET